MEALDYSMIQLKSTIEIERLLDLEIKREFNQHGAMKIRGIIHEDTNYQGAMRSTAEDTIEIKTTENAEDKKTLFKGVVCSVDVSCVEGTYYIEMQAYSGSIEMDLKKKRRSFQNGEMEYSNLVKQIAYEYNHGDAETPNGMKKKIQAPIIQYEETDWEFLKRIATHMNTVLLPDVQDNTPRVFVGIPEGRNRWNIRDDMPYRVIRDYHGYNMVKDMEDGAVQSTDFLYYEIQSYEDYEIGDEVSFRKKNLIVAAKYIRTDRGLILFTYVLAFKEKMVQNKSYNPNITGVGLIGTILEVKEEHARIHLDIDGDQKKDEAYWFNVNTLTGNALYCMPEVGTRWNLVVPNGDESYAEVVSSIRTNGGGCPKTSDPSRQYLSSDSGKEMAMSPASISFTSMESEEGTLKLNLDDEVGIRITSHKKLNISAKEDIEIRSKGSIIITGGETLMLQKGANGKGISLENEINLLNSKNIEFRGMNKIPFPPVEAPPPPEPKPKKKGFSWGTILKVAVAAVAVVAVAAVVVATGGAAAAAVAGVVLKGAAMGAAIGAATAIGTTAYQDIKNGEFSGFENYAKEVIMGAALGAITGAIFGPLVPEASAVVGRMAQGGLEGVVEEGILQMAQGYFDPAELAIAFGMGFGTAGLFEGGAKAIKGAFKGTKKVVGAGIDSVRKGLKEVGDKLDGKFNRIKEVTKENLQKAKQYIDEVRDEMKKDKSVYVSCGFAGGLQKIADAMDKVKQNKIEKNEIRERVLKNIEDSKAAREASNFKKYANESRIRNNSPISNPNNLVNNSGKFIDNGLESDYQKYINKKSKTGKVPRDRLGWKEARDYWLNDSPIARGNNFNAKAVADDWYPYHEVNLSTRKRLDSYDPIQKEIISRKATDLEIIQLSTFEKYLKEMKNKYAPGEVIRSNKYPELDGLELEGKQILEIPSSNQSLSNIQEYIDLAKNKYEIEIRFRGE